MRMPQMGRRVNQEYERKILLDVLWIGRVIVILDKYKQICPCVKEYEFRVNENLRKLLM